MSSVCPHANLSQEDFEARTCEVQKEMSKFVDEMGERQKELNKERLLIILNKAKNRANKIMHENERRSSEVRSLDGECSLALIEEDLRKIENLYQEIAKSKSGTVEHPPPVKVLDTSSLSDFDSETVVPSSDGRSVSPPLPNEANSGTALIINIEIPRRTSSRRLKSNVAKAKNKVQPAPKRSMSPEEAWQVRYNDLVEFKRKFGHCNVPARWKDKFLASWVARQRQRYKGNRRYGTKLSPDNVAKLEALGFQWVAPPRFPSWEDRYRELILFKNEHGHCDVPKRWKENQALGRWVLAQRKRYRGANRRSPISQDEINKLESIGFKWSLVGGGRIEDEAVHYNRDEMPAIGEGGNKRVVAI